MICSTCGYENEAGHRFCGMCGTPLPHRPLTAPGAQSTLSMTRVPMEQGSTLRQLPLVATPTGVLTDEANALELPSNGDFAPEPLPEPPPKSWCPIFRWTNTSRASTTNRRRNRPRSPCAAMLR